MRTVVVVMLGESPFAMWYMMMAHACVNKPYQSRLQWGGIGMYSHKGELRGRGKGIG